MCLLECPYGYYSESGECKPCLDPCISCSSAYNCSTCLFPYLLIGDYCELTDCLPETYEDNFICQPCSEACSGCYGPTNSDCIECNLPGGYMKDSSDKCYPRICTDGTYLDTKRTQCSICGNLCKMCDDEESCMECTSEVLNSIVNDETICSFCPDGYNYKRDRCEGNS